MSSKMNVKPAKRDARPRSSGAQEKSANKLRKGKRDGTPDKPTTPIASQDALLEEGGPMSDRKSVLINDEILSLQVKHEDLKKLREPRPPTDGCPTPPKHSVVVRKMKPASEWDKPKTRLVTVARPAPPSALLKEMDYSGSAGPRFDEVGNIIEHSILGSVEDFKKEAKCRGELPEMLTEIKDGERKPRVLSAKYERSRPSQHPQYESVEESNALKNWQFKMAERKRQQGHLSKLLNKPPEQLVMNQADTYRQTQELRYLIDRTIPTMDYGKGYRIGSEFWKQQERIGNDLTGIHMTMTQTDKGYPPPIEHIGVPKAIQEEIGTNWASPRTPFHKPWHKSAYLQERKAQLEPVMKELDPHKPDILNLELVGKPVDTPRRAKTGAQEELVGVDMEDEEESVLEEELGDEKNPWRDPLSDHPDVHPEPVFGPSILFAGKAARWTGDGHSFEGQVGCEARITMEAYAGHRATAHLEIVNDGTTSIYYDWKKIHKANPFDIVSAKVQRFYFNNSSGVILPGDNVKFPFVFKSPNAGVFTEQWQLQTHPVVCGGAALCVTLRGTSLQEDKYLKQRSELETELASKQAFQIVRGVIDELVAGIRTPERPSSPMDAYITESEIFSRKNPTLHYHDATVEELKKLHSELYPEEERENVEWDLDVNLLKQKIMMMEVEDDERDELLTRLNKAVISLAFPTFKPLQRQMCIAGQRLMAETVEKMVCSAISLRQVLGLPEKDDDTSPDESTEKRAVSAASGRSSAERSESRKATASRGGQKPDPKDSKKGSKDAKSKEPKTPAKEAPKPGGKVTPGPGAPAKRPPTRDQIITAERVLSPTTPSGVEPIVQTKYREKIYIQTYNLVSEMADLMAGVFAEIEQKEGSKSLLI